MNVEEISTGATIAAIVALIITIGALRVLPPREAAGGTQSTTYLMNQLIAKTGEAEKAINENKQLHSEINTLRQKVAALEAQVADLWSMLRQQGIRIDETRADANTAYNEPRRAAVRPPADVTLSEDVPFRDWLVAHFDIDELRTLCADLKLAEFPIIVKGVEAATHTIRESRKTGKLTALEHVALEKRPHVPSW